MVHIQARDPAILSDRTSLINAAIQGLDGSDAHVQALLRAYKHTLYCWVLRRLRRCLGQKSLESWSHLFLEAGSPSQSHYLYTTAMHPDRVILTDHFARHIEAETVAFNSAGILERSTLPCWIQTYFDENAALLRNPLEMIDLRNPKIATKALMRAHTLMGAVWEPDLQHVHATIQRIVFYRGKFVGFTGSTPRAYGAIFLTEHNLPPTQLACTLVHETAHHILHVIRSISPFFEELDSTPVYSPFRKETRTLLGVAHSGFALARMMLFLRRVMPFVSGRERHYAARRIVTYKACLEQTLDQLRAFSWTTVGSAVFAAMQPQCERGATGLAT